MLKMTQNRYLVAIAVAITCLQKEPTGIFQCQFLFIKERSNIQN